MNAKYKSKCFTHTELKETTKANKIPMVSGRLSHAMFLQKPGLFHFFLKVSVKTTTLSNNRKKHVLQ